MNAKGWTIVAAVAVLTFIGTRSLFPKTETQTEILRLPSETDTVTVTKIDHDTVFRTRVDSVVTTDTAVYTDTVWRTKIVQVPKLAPRWYVDTASFGQSLRDTSYISLTWIKADSNGIYRRDRLQRMVATPGPVKSLTADSAGLDVDFGRWPEPKDGCGIGCRLQWGLGGAAVGTLGILLFGP